MTTASYTLNPETLIQVKNNDELPITLKVVAVASKCIIVEHNKQTVMLTELPETIKALIKEDLVLTFSPTGQLDLTSLPKPREKKERSASSGSSARNVMSNC